VQIGEGDPLTLQLLDLTTGSIVGRPVKLGGTAVEPFQAFGPDHMAFSPDLKTVYVGTLDLNIWTYDLDPSSWAASACDDAGRNLTRAEWKTYIGSLGPYRATCNQYPPGS